MRAATIDWKECLVQDASERKSKGDRVVSMSVRFAGSNVSACHVSVRGYWEAIRKYRRGVVVSLKESVA